MMKFFRDFAYFSKGERNGFIILIAIILLLTVYVFFNKQFVPEPEHNPEAYQNVKSQFEKNYDPSLVEKASYDKENYQKDYRYNKYSDKKKNTPKKPKKNFTPFNFDPNTADLNTFQNLGFSEKQAQSILNYRNKGGKFRKPADFRKMYVVSDEHFQKLENYIVLAEPEVKTEQEGEDYTVSTDSTNSEKPKYKKELVDISLASAEELKTVYGIGEKLSERIVKYRDMLGGLHSPEQIKEIYGMSQENYERIEPQIYASNTILDYVDVNKAFASELKKHPYIKTWEFANQIVYHKRKHPFTDWEDFQNKLQLNDTLAAKLKPYLKFE